MKKQSARRHITKLFSYFEYNGSIINDTAILFIYNAQAPEESYILTERI